MPRNALDAVATRPLPSVREDSYSTGAMRMFLVRKKESERAALSLTDTLYTADDLSLFHSCVYLHLQDKHSWFEPCGCHIGTTVHVLLPLIILLAEDRGRE